MSLPTHHNVPQQRCITIWNVAIVSFATQQIPIVQQRNKILSTYAVQWPKVTHCQTIFGPRDIVTTTYTGILTRIGRFPPWRDQWWPHPSVLTGLQEAVTQTYTWYTLLLSHVFSNTHYIVVMDLIKQRANIQDILRNFAHIWTKAEHIFLISAGQIQ